jgi:hypothetical protein
MAMTHPQSRDEAALRSLLDQLEERTKRHERDFTELTAYRDLGATPHELSLALLDSAERLRKANRQLQRAQAAEARVDELEAELDNIESRGPDGREAEALLALSYLGEREFSFIKQRDLGAWVDRALGAAGSAFEGNATFSIRLSVDPDEDVPGPLFVVARTSLDLPEANALLHQAEEALYQVEGVPPDVLITIEYA